MKCTKILDINMKLQVHYNGQPVEITYNIITPTKLKNEHPGIKSNIVITGAKYNGNDVFLLLDYLKLKDIAVKKLKTKN